MKTFNLAERQDLILFSLFVITFISIGFIFVILDKNSNKCKNPIKIEKTKQVCERKFGWNYECKEEKYYEIVCKGE